MAVCSPGTGSDVSGFYARDQKKFCGTSARQSCTAKRGKPYPQPVAAAVIRVDALVAWLNIANRDRRARASRQLPCAPSTAPTARPSRSQTRSAQTAWHHPAPQTSARAAALGGFHTADTLAPWRRSRSISQSGQSERVFSRGRRAVAHAIRFAGRSVAQALGTRVRSRMQVVAQRILYESEQLGARNACPCDDMHRRRRNRRLASWEHFDRKEISRRARCPSWFKGRPLQSESMSLPEDRTGMLVDRRFHVVFQHWVPAISTFVVVHAWLDRLGQQAAGRQLIPNPPMHGTSQARSREFLGKTEKSSG